jgi:hypothetical protein
MIEYMRSENTTTAASQNHEFCRVLPDILDRCAGCPSVVEAAAEPILLSSISSSASVEGVSTSYMQLSKY